ncbi:anoctamin-10-like [Galendromus occidentalis]|uniref:Anoctamin n=1 Tax=Galendromus occidentalis TaxID=34638 RepID=A0AAJ6QMY2_9ACAR|nr:anoctamin-10-like [Galendromus occidentalis]
MVLGMWLHLFNFINYFGVVTNAFLIAFTSKFGSLYLRSRISKFMFIVAFEHLVFVVKYLLTLLIPDVPEAVKGAKARERQLLTYMMSRVASLTAERRPPTNASQNSRERISGASRNSVTQMDIQAVQAAAHKRALGAANNNNNNCSQKNIQNPSSKDLRKLTPIPNN